MSGLRDRAITHAASLDILRVDTWCPVGGKAALVGLLTTIVVDVYQVEGVDVSGDVSQ